MKHLLNNLSEEEKNRIREQHTGGMKVATEKFKKLVETKQGDVKPYVIKEVEGIEPIVDRDDTPTVLGFKFAEGSSAIPGGERVEAVRRLAKDLEYSLQTIQRFHKNPVRPLPKFVIISVGTSSTGSADANKRVADARMEEMKKIVLDAFAEWDVRADVALKVITKSSDNTYTPSRVDANFYDTTKMEPDDRERFGYITLLPLRSAGTSPQGIDNIADSLRIARGYNINPDEEGIAYAICRLQTYSDITDLNNELRNEGGLQKFINSSITNGWTSLGSDTEERRKIEYCLNKASSNSQKGHVAKIEGDMISLTI